MHKWILNSIQTIVYCKRLLFLHVLARTWSCWRSLWVFGDPYISGDTLCNYLCIEIPILSPLLNFIHTGMDENQQQSKVNKSADEVVSSIVNIFLANYALVIKRYILCLIFVLGVNIIFLWLCLWNKWKMHFVYRKIKFSS